MAPMRRRGQRAGLTVDAVVAAGLAVFERDDALTMRAVAAQLGVAPNALYSYVDGVDHLLDLILDDALGQVRVPEYRPTDQTSARRAAVDLMVRAFIALSHRAPLLPSFIARQGARGAIAQRLGLGLDAALKDAGVASERIPELRHVAIQLTIATAAFAAHPPLGPDGPGHEGNPPARTLEHALTWLIDGATTTA